MHQQQVRIISILGDYARLVLLAHRGSFEPECTIVWLVRDGRGAATHRIEAALSDANLFQQNVLRDEDSIPPVILSVRSEIGCNEWLPCALSGYLADISLFW